MISYIGFEISYIGLESLLTTDRPQERTVSSTMPVPLPRQS
jgi:hypothetical protein